MKIEEYLDKVKLLVNDSDLSLDCMRFDEGNASAGKRIRKQVQPVRRLLEDMRNKIQYEIFLRRLRKGIATKKEKRKYSKAKYKGL